jgi:Do/DeqQ family serine protease
MTGDDITIGQGPNRRAGGLGRRGAVAAALLLAGSVAGWSAGGAWNAHPSAAAVNAAPAPTVDRLPDGAVASYASIVDRVAPAVVTIRSERTVRNISQQMPDDPLFRQFFGDRFNGRQAPEPRERGLGSGVIVRSDGYILTNHHVVDGAAEVTAELPDGRAFKGKVVGTDAPSDLAVLKIDGKNLQTLPLGNSDQVRVGDVVLAVGNPLGVGQTVTMGIVSAKGRSTQGAGTGSFEDFIQTDAPINRGNSGGALVNTRGELIGINSQILTPSGGNIGIGFSIPANMAHNVMAQLIDRGEVRRGRLGVTIQAVTPDLAKSLGLSSVSGAIVSNVEPGSPAAAAGLKRGDVITALNGEAVKDGNVLRNHIAQQLPGTEVNLTVLRDGREQQLKAKLAELHVQGEQNTGEDSSGKSGEFGLAVEPLTRDRAQQLGVRAKSGLVVSDVEPGSRAADAGLRPGDVIEEVDRRPVTSADELRQVLNNGTRPALLLVHRGDATVFVTLPRGE